MKILKSLVAVMLVAALVFSFAACGGSSNSDLPKPSNPTTPPESIEPAAPDIGTSAKNVTVKVVKKDDTKTYDVTVTSDNAHDAFVQAGVITEDQGKGTPIDTVNGYHEEGNKHETWEIFINDAQQYDTADSVKISDGDVVELRLMTW